jgi:tRNA G18 (ribose-2'-O)-methylase SpoU
LEAHKPDIYGILAALYDYFMGERSLYVATASARKEDDDEDWVVKQQQLEKKNKMKTQAQQKKGGKGGKDSTPATTAPSATTPLHDLRLETSFFEMILAGLADNQDPLVRKRALYLLKRCIESSKRLQTDTKYQPSSWPDLFNWEAKKAIQLSRAWHSFFLILETLQEYDFHIVKPVWPHVKVLHADQTTPAPLHEAWKNLILRHGFSHKNALVKKHCILSYMSLFAAPQYLKALDRDTFLSFVDLAADPVVFSVNGGHQEQTPKRIFSSYISAYISALPEAADGSDQRSSLINDLLTRAQKQSFGPALMESTLVAFASLEHPVKALNATTFSTMAAIAQSNAAVFHFRHHRAVFSSILQALLKLSDVSTIPYDQVRRFVRSIPAALRKAFHSYLQEWLTSFGEGWLEKHLLSEIDTFPHQISSVSTTLCVADIDEADSAATQLIDLFVYVPATSLQTLCSKVMALNAPLNIVAEPKEVRKIILLATLLRFLRSAPFGDIAALSGVSSSSVIAASLSFRAKTTLQSATADTVCESLSQYDLYEAEGRLFSVGCEIASHLSVLQSSESSGFDSTIAMLSTELSSHLSTTASVLNELRCHGSITALSKILIESVLARKNNTAASTSAEAQHQLLQSLSAASIRNVSPSGGDHADARQRLKKLASGEGILLKWKALAAALKMTLRKYEGQPAESGAAVALASAKQMLSMCLEALPVGSDLSVTQVGHCIRFLIRAICLLDGEKSITPANVQSWLKSLWTAFKQFKDFSSRRVSQFSSIAFAPVFLRSTDPEIVATLKGYFNQLVTIGDTAMGVMNSVALRFSKTFNTEAGFASLDANWIPELASLIVYGVDRKGQTEGTGDARFDTGYGGPQQDFYARSLANKIVLDISARATTGEATAISIIDKLFNRLVLMSQNDPDVKGNELAKNTHPHRKVTRCWQTLSTCALSVSKQSYDKIAEWIWEQYRDVIQSTIRDLISCCLAVILGRFPDAASPFLLKILQWDHLVISHLEMKTAKEDAIFSSLAIGGAMLANPTLLSSHPDLFKSLLDCVIPYLTINTLFLRGVAHEVVRLIFANPANEQAFLTRVGPQVHALLKQLDSIIQVQAGIVADVKKRRREALAYNVARLLEISPAKVSVSLNEICQVLFVEQPTSSQIEISEIVDLSYTFDSYESTKAKYRNIDSQQQAQGEDLVALVVADRGNKAALESHMAELDLLVSSEAEQQNFQKKIIPWQQMNVRRQTNDQQILFPVSHLFFFFLQINSISDSGEEINEATKRPRQDIIIVATMLKKAANLGGLTRTAEIFQASQLVIPSKMVLQDKVYQQLCVTADQWVPMLEVPESGLKDYLISKKAEGYSLLGAEQTADSVLLTSVDWPQKTVLVLGDERTGIPAQFIHLLDRCVEIPQLGVVRSLNVHVTGSIMLWEYSRQHALSNQ